MAGKPFLDSLTFEVRYAFGQTYLDRCGQTLVDIERLGTGWITGDVNPNGGNIENPATDCAIQFDTQRFAFTASRIQGNLRAMAAACATTWDIVRANLALNEFVRVAARFQWLMSCDAIEQAESIIRKLPMNVSVPSELLTKYESTRRSVVAVLKSKETKNEYRVAIQGVSRVQGVPISSLLMLEPRMLPEHRRKAQLELFKKRATYDTNPQYAVNLDVECVSYGPKELFARDFIMNNEELAVRDFLPLMNEK